MKETLIMQKIIQQLQI